MFRFVTFTLLLACYSAQTIGADNVDYTTQIKPVLKLKCYSCHGTLQQQANLRLDTGMSLISGGDSGTPINVDDPSASLLIEVITGEAGFLMPPEDAGAALSEEEIKLFSDWIAQGAKVPKTEEPQADPKTWWSYQPVSSPTLPSSDSDWARNPIDHFIEAARSAAKLPHNDEASREEWLRRVTIDLTGLPPTRQELLTFMGDTSTNAYEKVVDQLLDRPQYGERWGRHWMDIWRYSDWYGSRGINEIRYSQRHIWRWRDWIVNSLNSDKGYDQMVREMLAADELAGKDKETIVATGYLGRNWYKFDRNVRLFSTVERTAEAFLGVTLRCARCHDHKYDPISQEEYYQFRAFFEPQYVRTDRVSALTETEKDATLGQVLTDGLPVAFDHEPDRPTYRFNRGDDRFPDESRIIAPGVPTAIGGPPLEIQPVDLPAEVWYPILREGVRETLVEAAIAQVKQVEADLEQANQDALEISNQLEAFSDTPQPESPTESVFLHDDFAKADNETWRIVNGNWVYENGHLILKDPINFATIATRQNQPRDFKVHLKYKALEPGTYRSIGFSYDYIDYGNSQDVYTSTNDNRQSVQAFHRVGGKQTYPTAGIVYLDLEVGKLVTLDVTVNGTTLAIDVNGERKLDYELPIDRQDGKFSLWVHNGAAEFHELKITALQESLETLKQRHQIAQHNIELAKQSLVLATAQLTSVQARLRASIAEYIHPADNLDELKQQAALAERTVKLIEAELELSRLSKKPETLETTKAIETANKKLLDAKAALENPGDTFAPLGEQHPKTSTGRRSALANWITHPSNPRTARVAINHLWARHFGTPLVETTENFGLNGRQPTHPELLDWLASELITHNWQMKQIHKLIVLSATYRMSTLPHKSALRQDPDNQYYWRMNSRRMEAEVVRDSVLYLSGQLDLARGGPEIDQALGESTLRRSIYFRNTPNEKMEMLEVFDVADPNSCYRRKESVVPHQALAMMNSSLTQTSARLLATQLGGAENDFINTAFQTVLTRSPSPEERTLCSKFLQEHAKILANDNSDKFPASSPPARPPAATPEARARENLIHVLLLHNDFVTVR